MIFGAGMFLTSSLQLATARPVGVDVSNYQGSGINWTSVKNAGISFAWAKATEGTTFIDADFTINMSHAKSAGVPIGAYHFAHPNSHSPGSEASYFWAEAGGYILADGKSFMPMLDMEVFSGVVGASSYSAWANAWCSDIVTDAEGNGVVVKPFIYVSSCNACEFNTSVGQWFADLANYNGESSQSGNPWNVCSSCEEWGSGVWNVWQYSSAGAVSGITGAVDVDVINGSSVSPYIATSVGSGSSGSSSTVALKLRGDFNGDGLDDFALFRPSDGMWLITFSSDNSLHTFQFGQSGDIPLLSGDFNGDGAADAVLFRPSTHEWYVRFSSDASIHSFNFGQTSDVPLLGGDFDGDGVPDAVLFRPSAHAWYVRFSSDASVHTFGFGTPGDIPMLANDFDGDGAPDAVLFRPSTHEWYVRFSSDGSVHSFNFGQSTDIPFMGDFDGDGAPDATLFRPSTGEWYVRFSSDGSVHNFGFGDNGDIPWAGYFTADGSIDQVLYRPSNGTFYIRDAATGVVTSSGQIGTSSEIPVP